MKLTKVCLICKKSFLKPYYVSLKTWKLRKYCSQKCFGIGLSLFFVPWNKNLKGIHLSKKSEFKKGNIPWHKGKKTGIIPKTSFKIGHTSWNWKGDRVGYGALHMWTRRYLGKPTTCEHCGKTGLTGRQIHWANKDHKYRRKLTDWIRLCTSCHKEYDRKNQYR